MSELVTRRTLLSSGVALGIGSLAGCSGLLASDESSDSWPMARHGPGGHAANPSAPGPKDSLSEAWSVSVEDLRSDAGVEAVMSNLSAPVVADGSIFVASWESVMRQDGSADSRACYVHKIAESGEITWSSEPLTSSVVQANSPVSLAVVSGTVYVVAPDSSYQTGLYALDAESGEVLWEHDKYALGKPIVHDGEVIVEGSADTGTVYAVSTDGSHAWTYTATDEEGNVRHPTGTVAVDDQRTYLPLRDGIHAVDRSGERAWHTDVTFMDSFSENRASPRSIVAGDLLYAPVGQARQTDGKLFALDPADGSVRWEFQPDFDADRRRQAIERVPENESHTGLRLGVYGPPALADGTLYVFGYELPASELDEWWTSDSLDYYAPKLYALSAENGSVEWETPLDGPHVWTAPVVADGTVYFPVGGEEAWLLAIDAESGDVLDRMAGYPSVTTDVAVAGERLYVSEFSGDLLAVGPT